MSIKLRPGQNSLCIPTHVENIVYKKGFTIWKHSHLAAVYSNFKEKDALIVFIWQQVLNLHEIFTCARLDACIHAPERVTYIKSSSEPLRIGCNCKAGKMAQNLSFSIANILRSDFPPPSHIRHVPRCIYLERLNDSRNFPYVALRCQLDRRASFCNETEFFARNYYSAHTLSVISEKDAKIQNSGYVREQQRKKGMWSLFIFFKHAFNCSIWVHFSSLSSAVSP